MSGEELLKQYSDLKETNKMLTTKLSEAVNMLQQSQLQERQFELSRISLVSQIYNNLISNNYQDAALLKACSNDILENLIRVSDTEA